MLNTKLLLIASSLLMALSGFLLQFFPHELLSHLHVEPDGILPLLVQMMGALYLGSAMTNWMAQTVLIGGIYARFLAMGNFTHFTVGAIAVLKVVYATPDSWAMWVAATLYSLFAILFGIVLFTHPLGIKDTAKNKGRTTGAL